MSEEDALMGEGFGEKEEGECGHGADLSDDSDEDGGEEVSDEDNGKTNPKALAWTKMHRQGLCSEAWLSVLESLGTQHFVLAVRLLLRLKLLRSLLSKHLHFRMCLRFAQSQVALLCMLAIAQIPHQLHGQKHSSSCRLSLIFKFRPIFTVRFRPMFRLRARISDFRYQISDPFN